MFRRFARLGWNVIRSNRCKDQHRYTCFAPLRKDCLVSKCSFEYDNSEKFYKTALIGASVFSWLGFDKEENVEDDIILNIKRSILWIQKKEFARAEQVLHLALRSAQQTLNDPAITYIYDIMANLALQTNQLDKAEKLFVTVMQRLLSKGVPENDSRNVHISLKLARICQLKGDLEKADVGFRWCLHNLEKFGEDIDRKTLYGLAKDWYGHSLHQQNRYEEAISILSEAYTILTQVQEDNYEQAAILLNDIATAYENLENYNTAEEYLQQAIKIGKKADEMRDYGVIYVNLGRVYMKKGFYEKARKSCGMGFRLGYDRKNDEIKQQARQCIRDVLKLDK